MFLVPRPAPRWNSPRPAMSASLARLTFAPVARLIIASSGAFLHGRLGGLTSTPRLMSIGPGAAIVMLRTFSRPRCRSISPAAQSTIACGVGTRCVLVLMLATICPSERASATRTWVPPRSIPASTSGSEQLLAAQRGQDLDRPSGPIERVEVKSWYAGFDELGALPHAVLDTEGADRVVVRRFVDRGLQRGGDRR